MRRLDAAEELHGAIDLYWIPLGAGAHVVRLSGRLFEACSALLHRRPRCELYHSALIVHVPEGRFVVEQAPVVNYLTDLVSLAVGEKVPVTAVKTEAAWEAAGVNTPRELALLERQYWRRLMRKDCSKAA